MHQEQQSETVPQAGLASATADKPMPKGLAIALAAFDEAARVQREKRAAAGLGPVRAVSGFNRIDFRAFLEAIPWQDSALDERPEPITADGGAWCASCLGARWRKVQVPYGIHTVELARCSDCLDTTVAESRNVLARHAGLVVAQRAKTFATFQPPKDRAQLQAVRLIASWAADPDGWLVLHGIPGSGKSHLGLAVANALIQRLRQVRWFYVPELVLAARERLLGAGEQGYFAWLRELRDCPVLVLDDLGAVRVSEWAVQELLEPLMDARYRGRLPTFVTCIAEPEYQRANLSDSIGRRFQDPTVSTVVAWTAPQWSGEKAA